MSSMHAMMQSSGDRLLAQENRQLRQKVLQQEQTIQEQQHTIAQLEQQVEVLKQKLAQSPSIIVRKRHSISEDMGGIDFNPLEMNASIGNNLHLTPVQQGSTSRTNSTSSKNSSIHSHSTHSTSYLPDTTTTTTDDSCRKPPPPPGAGASQKQHQQPSDNKMTSIMTPGAGPAPPATEIIANTSDSDTAKRTSSITMVTAIKSSGDSVVSDSGSKTRRPLPISSLPSYTSATSTIATETLGLHTDEHTEGDAESSATPTSPFRLTPERSMRAGFTPEALLSPNMPPQLPLHKLSLNSDEQLQTPLTQGKDVVEKDTSPKPAMRLLSVESEMSSNTLQAIPQTAGRGSMHMPQKPLQKLSIQEDAVMNSSSDLVPRRYGNSDGEESLPEVMDATESIDLKSNHAAAAGPVPKRLPSRASSQLKAPPPGSAPAPASIVQPLPDLQQHVQEQQQPQQQMRPTANNQHIRPNLLQQKQAQGRVTKNLPKVAMPYNHKIKTGGGVERNLPRDLSIRDHVGTDEDVTYYTAPAPDAAKEVYQREVVDAFGERGIFTGSINAGTSLPDGYGEMKYREGRVYRGEWQQGHWVGFSTYINSLGDVYEGSFENDQKHGDGKLVFADGRVFEGRFDSDQMRDGLLRFQDGSSYKGLLQDGKRNGFGLYIFADGSNYEGQWVDDRMHGRGKMEWNDLGWYSGDWNMGVQHGVGMEVLPDGTLRHQGKWENGNPVQEAPRGRRKKKQPVTETD